jgi:hypothetical protein
MAWYVIKTVTEDFCAWRYTYYQNKKYDCDISEATVQHSFKIQRSFKRKTYFQMYNIISYIVYRMQE